MWMSAFYFGSGGNGDLIGFPKDVLVSSIEEVIVNTLPAVNIGVRKGVVVSGASNVAIQSPNDVVVGC